ncbi:hypothetical protein Geu3261_0298_003 [Komagataeibacter europaeus NBRC 3261]|uniref:Uncharacterized protein n=1 Tax=Komagataeibacter europaeus NBRC 3261 TaxID=1234669 RepID=A0A0D6Q3J1_KOMEU|nr:hypothetical protein [Komagataeibacter europaeus]GAN97873.1 hypothetical protein Geu3261_0298_003 [Komagataeibacter europaeus NBRC 3261]
MTTETKITPEISHRLLEWASDPFMTYEQMAYMLKLKGCGNAMLTPAEIATFLGAETNAAPALNRLRRDRELAEWLRQNQSTGTLDDICMACIGQFGAAPVPPKAEIKAFLEKEKCKYQVGDIVIPSKIAEFLLDYVTGAFITYEQLARMVRVKFGRDTKLTAAEIATFLGCAKKGAPFLNQLQRDHEVAEWLRENQTLGSFDQIREACIAQFNEHRVPSRTTVAAFLKGEGRKCRLGDTDFFSDKPDVKAWLIAEYPNHKNDALQHLCREKFGKERTPSQSMLSRLLRNHQKTTTIRRHGIWIDEELSAWLQDNARLLRITDLYAEAVKRFGPERVRSQSAVYQYLRSLKDRSLTRYKTRKEVEEGLRQFYAKKPTT